MIRPQNQEILLKTDVSENGPGWSNERIAEALETSLSNPHPSSFEEVRMPHCHARMFLVSTSDSLKCRGKTDCLTCSEPPKSHTHWTLRLLEKRVVELGIVESASDTTSIGCSKKRSCRIEAYWVIPSEASAGIVAAMRATLEVYTRPHDPTTGVPGQNIKAIIRWRPPLPHGIREARINYEYERAGAANLFMHFRTAGAELHST